MSVAEAYGFSFADEGCIQAPFQPFPCRKCIPCLIARQKAWVSRLVEELRNHPYNYFVTLTYDDEHVPVDSNGEMCFDKKHLIKLNQDMRKRFQQGKLRNPVEDVLLGSPEYIELPKDVKYKYYITTEYGPNTFRPHAHGVWYGLPESLHIVELLFRTLWPYGFVSVFPAQEGAAGYISKYLVSDGVGKESYTGNGMPPFSLMSKGLGVSYIERMGDWHRADPRRMFTQYHGSKGTMDRYLKHKIYSEDVLEDYADKQIEKHWRVKERYYKFQLEHPSEYRQLIAERHKYFADQKDSIAWQTNKKKHLK